MNKNEVLKTYFGYESFREGQESIVDALLCANDALGIMPTGAGKSLCFQIPAMVFEGITLVISPLISLMKDQVMALVASGVPAAFFNSLLNDRQYLKAIENAKKGMYKIIYVAPERLLTQRFQSFITQMKVSMVVIDEAHCVSQWGQDFRPSYLDIPIFLKTLNERPVVSAFTATATKVVKNDIVNLIGLREPKIVVTGFDRGNLYFKVLNGVDKKESLLDIVRSKGEQSGIVYCSTRKNVEEVCAFLNENGLEATRYHAGLEQKERSKNQDDFLYDLKQIMVATNAFGMGIDKSDVRFVVHYNMPKDLESYYQEAGRAGRDGAEADCILLYGVKDLLIVKFLINSKKDTMDLDEKEIEKLIAIDMERLKSMVEYCKTSKCLRGHILKYFGEKPKRNCENCYNCEITKESIVRSFFKEKIDNELYIRLKKLRKVIASQRGVPAFVIFTDKTLKDMCKKLPKDEREFMDVSGVGVTKTNEYGKEFICVIKEYLEER